MIEWETCSICDVVGARTEIAMSLVEWKDPEGGLVYSRVWRTWDGPHGLVVGAIGKEKAVSEIGVEDGPVVGEPPVRRGVAIRDCAPLLSTQPTPWKGRQDQNLRLGLSRADLRYEP